MNAATVRAMAIRAAVATMVAAKHAWRVLHAVIAATKRHVPAWVATLLTVCLFIPGPVDEFLVLFVIVGYAAFKPAMRADLAVAIRTK